MTTRDALGDRMKEQYEFRARSWLPRRTQTVIRLDGRAFHTYTRGLDKPFDAVLLRDLTETLRYLCREVTGTRLGYAQSDELSLVLTDYERPTTQAWFDGNVQKICSVTASLATAFFNRLRPSHPLACFDARAFTIPDAVEVHNYLVWRQADATRNSISSAAQAHFPHEELQGLTGGELQEKLWSEAEVNWNDYDERFKRGTVCYPELVIGDVEFALRDGQTGVATDVARRVWQLEAAPIFTREPGFVPQHVFRPSLFEEVRREEVSTE